MTEDGGSQPVDATVAQARAADRVDWVPVVGPGAPRKPSGDPPVSMRRVLIGVVAASLVVLGVVAFAGSVIARRIAERQGVHDAAVMTDMLATSAVQPQLTDSMLSDPA